MGMTAGVILQMGGTRRPSRGAQDPSAVEASLSLRRRLIQHGLRTEGFDARAPDDLFGPRTRDGTQHWAGGVRSAAHGVSRRRASRIASPGRCAARGAGAAPGRSCVVPCNPRVGHQTRETTIAAPKSPTPHVCNAKDRMTGRPVNAVACSSSFACPTVEWAGSRRQWRR